MAAFAFEPVTDCLPFLLTFHRSSERRSMAAKSDAAIRKYARSTDTSLPVLAPHSIRPATYSEYALREAKGLVQLLKRGETVESIRNIIRITPEDEKVMRQHAPNFPLRDMLIFRGEVLTAFNQIVSGRRVKARRTCGATESSL